MNSFGGSTQYPLYDPRPARGARERFGREALPALAWANSLYVPSGRWPARGWMLLARSDYDSISKYSTSLQLSIGDPRRADNVGVLSGLAIVQAQCVTTGILSDPNALYLVEVTDARGLLHNKWFQAPAATMYNIRAPAYPQTFHPGSMNGGTTWTWSTMLGDMWATASAAVGGALGSWPGLPSGFTPQGTPEGFWFPGVPLWYALNDVLDYLGMTVACDLTAAAPYTVVHQGSADTAFDALQLKYAPNLEDDQDWIDTGAGRVPGTVKVLFRRRNSTYGTEEAVRYDSPQWNMAAYYSVSISAPATFSGAVGTHYLWADYTVRYDMDGVPLTADTATAAAIAQDRVDAYYAKVYGATVGSMSQLYTGALPFTVGSQVDGVRWYQDYHGLAPAAWRTQIVRGVPCPPFAEVGQVWS